LLQDERFAFDQTFCLKVSLDTKIVETFGCTSNVAILQMLGMVATVLEHSAERKAVLDVHTCFVCRSGQSSEKVTWISATKELADPHGPWQNFGLCSMNDY